MRKFISTLLLCILFFVPIFTFETLAAKEIPTSTPFPSSYELFYPVIAVKIPENNIYQLKLFKEKLIGKFMFSTIKIADYHLLLSKKRLVKTESQILKIKNFHKLVKILIMQLRRLK